MDVIEHEEQRLPVGAALQVPAEGDAQLLLELFAADLG